MSSNSSHNAQTSPVDNGWAILPKPLQEKLVMLEEIISATKMIEGNREAALERINDLFKLGPGEPLARSRMCKGMEAHEIVLFVAQQHTQTLVYDLEQADRVKVCEDKALWLKLQRVVGFTPEDVEDFEWTAYVDTESESYWDSDWDSSSDSDADADPDSDSDSDSD